MAKTLGTRGSNGSATRRVAGGMNTSVPQTRRNARYRTQQVKVGEMVNPFTGNVDAHITQSFKQDTRLANTPHNKIAASRALRYNSIKKQQRSTTINNAVLGGVLGSAVGLSFTRNPLAGAIVGGVAGAVAQGALGRATVRHTSYRGSYGYVSKAKGKQAKATLKRQGFKARQGKIVANKTGYFRGRGGVSPRRRHVRTRRDSRGRYAGSY